MVGDVTGGTTVLNVTDPAGDDNGPGTYQYPTASDFHAGRLRPDRLPGDQRRHHRVPAGHAGQPGPDLRRRISAPSCWTSTCTPRAPARPRPRPPSHPATTPSRPRGPGASGSRPRASPSPVWVDASGNSGRHRLHADRRRQPDRHDRAAGGPVRHAGLRLGVQRRADRAGRVQPDQARAFTRDAGALHVRRLRRPAGRARSARWTPATVPKAMDVITPSGRVPGHRARPHPRARWSSSP